MKTMRGEGTNLLDLGAWMALQSIVEKKHHLLMKEKNSLAKTVEIDVACLPEGVLDGIHKRWKKVLNLIIEDEGNNDKVEGDRGLKKNPIDLAHEEELTGEETVAADIEE